MTHIDTTNAEDVLTGDNIEVWDSEAERYVIETVTRVESEDDDNVIIYTEENPEDGWAFPWDAEIRLFLPL